jgi:hypothetical protein
MPHLEDGRVNVERTLETESGTVVRKERLQGSASAVVSLKVAVETRRGKKNKTAPLKAAPFRREKNAMTFIAVDGRPVNKSICWLMIILAEEQ